MPGVHIPNLQDGKHYSVDADNQGLHCLHTEISVAGIDDCKCIYNFFNSVICSFNSIHISHRIGGNLKLLRESTNADQKRLKKHFRLQIVVLDCQFAI